MPTGTYLLPWILYFCTIAPKTHDWVKKLTLKQQIAQLLMVGIPFSEPAKVKNSLLTHLPVGGVVLFSRNLQHPEQIAALNQAIRNSQKHAAFPPFIATDQEGGVVSRFHSKEIVNWPGNMALGATQDAHLAQLAGQSIGETLHTLGFNMNLAPVLDININPRNAVIGIRAFGDEPKQVARLGIAAIKGLQNAHIIPVGKHFPGHGGTEVDSHKKMPIVLADLPALLKGSLLPFRDAIEAKLPAIMTAHIALPKLTNNKILPATFSSEIIQGLLRKQFHFSGLIMTDALEMDAVSEHFSPAEAAIRAVLAGADMILIDWNRDHQQQVYSGLLHAYQQGRLPPKRLREAVEHILALKERYQFNKLTYIAPNKVVHALRAHYAAHEKIARDITQKALTLVEDPQTLVPIQTPLWRHILVLTPEGPFADKARMRKAQVIALPMWPNRQQRYRAIAQIKQIVPRTQKIIALLPNHHYVELFESVHKRAPKHPSIVVALNSPYFLRYLPASMTKLCTYDDDAYGQDAVYQALIGKLKAKGHMPVQWPGRTH